MKHHLKCVIHKILYFAERELLVYQEEMGIIQQKFLNYYVIFSLWLRFNSSSLNLFESFWPFDFESYHVKKSIS